MSSVNEWAHEESERGLHLSQIQQLKQQQAQSRLVKWIITVCKDLCLGGYYGDTVSL